MFPPDYRQPDFNDRDVRMAFRRFGLVASPIGKRNGEKGAKNSATDQTKRSRFGARRRREKMPQFIKTFAGLPQLGR
jgi:hypothetical protein